MSVLVALLMGCAGGAEPPPADAPDAEPAGDRVGHRQSVQQPLAQSAEEAQAIYDAALAGVAGRAPEKETVTVEGAQVVLYRWEDPRLILSEACVADGAPASCQALDALRDVTTKTIEIGPGTPAAYYCEPAGGQRVAATGEDGGQSGLCRFADGSMLADWSLVYVPAFGKEALSKGR